MTAPSPDPTARAWVRIRFLSYWSAGSGASASGDVDRGCVRERESGLPYLPARQLKGHLRESAVRLGRAGDPFWVAHLEDLFGAENRKRSLLRFGDARMFGEDRASLEARRDLVPHLFHRLANVRIDGRTGTARHHMLRMTEAVAPVELASEVEFDCANAAHADLSEWRERLDEVCAVTLAVGGLKTDGLGEALLSVEPLRCAAP